MDYLFTRKQIRGKVIRFTLWVLLMWLIYVGYRLFSDYYVTISDKSNFWNSSGSRFALREVMVYSFGFMGYSYLKREKLHPNFSKQFWILLAFFDFLCIGIGLFRVFVFEITILQNTYNRMLGVIGSPLYSICIGIYALYFSYDENAEAVS